MTKKEAKTLRKGYTVELINTNKAGRDTNIIPCTVVDIKVVAKTTYVLVRPTLYDRCWDIDIVPWRARALEELFPNHGPDDRWFTAKKLRIIKKGVKITKIRRVS